MPRIQDLAKRLKKLLPPNKRPYDVFFENVRAFLKGPGKAMVITTAAKLRHFDDLLTAAVERDSQTMVNRVGDFEKALENIKDAFGTAQCQELFYFTRRYLYFAYNITRDHERVSSELFPVYMERLTELVNEYKGFRDRFLTLSTPLTWPIPKTFKEIISPLDLNKEFNKKWMEVNKIPPADKRRVTIAIKNFEMAIHLVDKLQNKIILPQYAKIQEWLKESKCFEHFYKELDEEKKNFLCNMTELKENYENQINILKDISSHRTSRTNQIQGVADMSIEAVKSAVQYCPQAVTDYQNGFHTVVSAVYAHSSRILDRFCENLRAVPTWEDEKAQDECQKALDFCENWKITLEFQTLPFGAEYFKKVLGELPKLWKYVRFFTIEYHAL